MAKWQLDAFLDQSLSWLAGTIVLETVCNAQPANYTEASATYKLADIAVDSADFSIADGDVSGRKVTIGAQTGVTVDASGTASHIALCTGGSLVYVTTCTAQVLTLGNSVNIPAWDIEILDVTP